MSNQHNAVLLDGKDKPFRVGTVETLQPGKDEVLIRNKAIAINPVDWKIQDSGSFIRNWPVVIGEDLAGIVEAVGEGVTRFKQGQRVIAHSQALGTQRDQDGAFSELSLINQKSVAAIPDSVSFEDGSVLPLAISTAAAGLYQSQAGGHLGLDVPTANPKRSGKTLLVWGGSSSVGTATIQLAVASGLTVLTTCSSRNQQLVEKLGAKFYDYNSPSIVGDLVAELGKGEFAGAYDAIGSLDSQMQCGQVIASFGGGRLVIVLSPEEQLPVTVKASGVFAISIFNGENAPVGKAVWEDFLPQALASGQLVPAPAAEVVGKGLESVEEACKKQKAGVSGKKIVVAL